MQKKSRRSPRTALADVNTDAELIRLGHERDVAFARTNASGRVLHDSELSDRCDVLNELEYAIQDTPARTLAGLAVKARIATQYISPKCPDGRILDDIVPILIEDILRLAERAAKHLIAEPVRPRTAEEV